MTAALLLSTALLASSPTPLADAFWSRDLAKATAVLASPPSVEEKERGYVYPVFSDVVRLVRCEPLPALPENRPPHEKALRMLVRLEEARRFRLGPAAARSETIWRDILTPGFFDFSFERDDGELLIWPVEEESWSGEELRARVKPGSCDRVPTRKPQVAELPDDTLLEALRALARLDPSFQGVAAAAAYHRASDAMARGQFEEARRWAEGLDAEFLPWPMISGYAALLRLETGLDHPDGYEKLIGKLDRQGDAAVRVRSAHAAAVRGDWKAVLAVSEPVADTTPCEPSLTIERDLLARRAMALDALRMDPQLEALLADNFPWCAKIREPSIELIRDLAVRFYARRGMSHARMELLQKLTPPTGTARTLRQYGAWALRRGDLTAARVVSSKLRTTKDLSARTRGWSLEAEIAFWLQDPARFELAVAELFPRDGLPEAKASDREERDRAAMELAQALVTSAGDKATEDFKRKLHAQLIRMRENAALRREDAFTALLVALEPKPIVPAVADGSGRRPVASFAIGDVDLSLRASVPPAPVLQLTWPEPFSLLGIPSPSLPGWKLRPWFSPSDEAVHAQN